MPQVELCIHPFVAPLRFAPYAMTRKRRPIARTDWRTSNESEISVCGAAGRLSSRALVVMADTAGLVAAPPDPLYLVPR